MELTVIPHLAGEHTATLWFGVTAKQPPGALRVRISGVSHDLAAPPWIPMTVPVPALDSRTSAAPFWYFRHSIGGLTSDTVYRVHAEFAANPGATAAAGRAAQAMFRTLPARLSPSGVGTPLRLDLRSCFYLKNGRATARLPRADTSDPPHLKILCGDQVYLDLPWHERMGDEPDRFLSWLGKYRENWSVLAGTFASVLGHGANLFVADDHEFWNNYPFFAIYKPKTWSPRVRAASGAIARALFCAFQADYQATRSGVQAVDIGPPGRPELSLRALDCRYFRTLDRFAPPADIQAICRWLSALRCPGVLVLSQPLLEPAANAFARRLIDAGLADFPDSYIPLVKAIRDLRHDLMILSGDIHCGRVSSVHLGGGRTLWEVVSSPVALCSPPYHSDPPTDALTRTDKLRVTATVEARTAPVRRDHHAILDFTRSGASVHVKVHFEALDRSAQPLPPDQEIRLT